MNYETLSIGEIKYRTDYRHVYTKSHKSHLTPTEHRLFVLLLQNAHNFVSIVKIIETTYDMDTEPHLTSVVTIISRLRKKIKPFGIDIFAKRIKNNDPKTYSCYKLDYIK